MNNFAITGVAGYVAPRHLKAIRDTGNRLIAAVDPHDSVGVLDSFFPDTCPTILDPSLLPHHLCLRHSYRVDEQ